MKLLSKYVLFLVIISTISCDKDPIEVKDFLIVGIYDSDMIINDIDPDRLIDPRGSKSEFIIDFNDDLYGDINLSVLNQRIHGGLILRNSELRAETLNRETFVMADSLYVQVLSLGDTITLLDNWENGSRLLLQSKTGFPPPGGNIYHIGPWKGKSENYIGIRYNERLGWIKIGVPDYAYMTVYEYAIRK